MNLDELISMNIGDRVINSGNIWNLTMITYSDKDFTTYYFRLASGEEYTFRIQVAHNWKTKTSFFYDYEDANYCNMLDPFLEKTDIYTTVYSKENHIKLLEEKKQYYFSEITAIDKQIEKLRN
jgi:hypothetical protein